MSGSIESIFFSFSLLSEDKTKSLVGGSAGPTYNELPKIEFPDAEDLYQLICQEVEDRFPDLAPDVPDDLLLFQLDDSTEMVVPNEDSSDDDVEPFSPEAEDSSTENDEEEDSGGWENPDDNGWDDLWEGWEGPDENDNADDPTPPPPNQYKEFPTFAQLSNFQEVNSTKTNTSVANLIGGEVKALYTDPTSGYVNSCALRISYILNSIPGHEIPYIPDIYEPNLILSGDKNADGIAELYIVNVPLLKEYLSRIYGAPVPFNSPTSNVINNKQGVILYISYGGKYNHADVWTGSSLINSYQWTLQDYFTEYKVDPEAYFWECKP